MRDVAVLAKLFMSGLSQAVRLPKSCRFEGLEVYAQRVGNSVVLSPKTDDWPAVVETMFAGFAGAEALERAPEWEQAERVPLG